QRACPGRADHAVGRRALAEMRVEPAGEPHIGNARRVVGVVMGEKLHVDPADRNPELVEPDRGAATGVDEKFLLARLHQRARAERVGPRDRHAGPEEGHAETAGRHGLILMPASLMTLPQRAISACTRVPNASGGPPPASMPSLAKASPTFSLLMALSTAAL